MFEAFSSLCADIPPAELASDPDISGIGVTIAYTSTAALALMLVMVNYILVYHPDTTSVAEREGIKHNHPSRINPIDAYLLYWRLGSKRYTHGIERWGEKGLRVKTALTYAMLTMSDFQLITGLSILISGFTQLSTGISAYHWQRLVQLAWFSSITHLCTLTSLRSYFRQNPLGYFWRLPGMIILNITLIVALVPTGHYTWESSTIRLAQEKSNNVRPKPTDRAVCYFNHHEVNCSSDYWYPNECEEVFQASQQRMILSAVFLALGMCNRLWHLFRLPARLYNSTRSYSSYVTTTFLSHMYGWTVRWSLWCSTPFVIFVYLPLLAIFLTFRLLADMITSRAFEVWWLMLSFCWGTLNLWMRPTLNEDGRNTWTFGQVMALLIVFAPLITLIEGYVKAATQNLRAGQKLDTAEGIEFIYEDSRITSIVGLITSPTSQEDDFINPHPAHDYYNDRFGFPVLVYSTLFSTALISALLIIALRMQDLRPSDIVSPGSTASFRFSLVPPILILLGYLGFCMLLSLVCEISTPKGKKYRRWCRFLHFMLYIIILVPPSLTRAFVTYIAMIVIPFYLFMSVVHTFRRSKAKRKEFQSTHGTWTSSPESTITSATNQAKSGVEGQVLEMITRPMTSEQHPPMA